MQGSRNGAHHENGEASEDREISTSSPDLGSTSTADERASALIHGALPRTRKPSAIIQASANQNLHVPSATHHGSNSPGVNPGTAREQFLNYFFGNSPTAAKQDNILPDLEQIGHKKSDSLDMKSLEKHLELVRL